jgi:ABC-2 type transport system ATP-binding protein
MLKIEHLTKKYGAKVAVDDLSLEIKPGEIYGFIGHNGAGKTTTIRCACGLLDFDEGEITINGRSIREDPLACKMDFAYIPDNPVLFDFLSGIDYLNFIGDVYKVEKSVREERIRRYSGLYWSMKSMFWEIASAVPRYTSSPVSAFSRGVSTNTPESSESSPQREPAAT